METELPKFLTDPAFYISLSSAALSLWVFFVHDRKLKKQEWLLNQYQLDKITEEKELNDKAFLKLKFRNDPFTNFKYLHVTNTSNCTANKIVLDLVNKDQLKFDQEVSPFKLSPGASKDIKVKKIMEVPEWVSITVLWQDKYAEDNRLTYTINGF